MITAAKKAIYAILSNADVTDEALLSAVVGAEGLINSRPLTYQTANPQDPVLSPPTTFCTGSWGVGSHQTLWIVQPSILADASGESKDSRHFWHWRLREWLPNLNIRKKWFREQENFQEGDVVIVMSPDTPRRRWPLGRITKVHSWQDRKVRVVDVQVGREKTSGEVHELLDLLRVNERDFTSGKELTSVELCLSRPRWFWWLESNATLPKKLGGVWN